MNVPFQAIPRERAFFDLFGKAADNLVATARELAELSRDLSSAAEHTGRIVDLEHRGDDLTHTILDTLNTTFVTPFDRTDVYALASGLDDIVDAQQAAAEFVVLHRIRDPIPEFAQQVDVLVRACDVLAAAVKSLHDLRELNGWLVEVNRLENEGDRLYRRAVARLYSGSFGPMDVLRWKDVVDAVEEAIDGCEDIANTIESIQLKYE